MNAIRRKELLLELATEMEELVAAIRTDVKDAPPIAYTDEHLIDCLAHVQLSFLQRMTKKVIEMEIDVNRFLKS